VALRETGILPWHQSSDQLGEPPNSRTAYDGSAHLDTQEIPDLCAQKVAKVLEKGIAVAEREICLLKSAQALMARDRRQFPK
jgi:hypothetical protein